MITKVQQLTWMNADALRQLKLGKSVGASVAEFDGTPTEALRVVDDAITASGTYARSLYAVRRKLQAAVVKCRTVNIAELPLGVTRLTPVVQITKEASDGPVTAEIERG